jgi:O-antigen/teichoic acid export membrane protein
MPHSVPAHIASHNIYHEHALAKPKTFVPTQAQPSPATAESSGALRRLLAQHTLQLLAGRIALFVFGYPVEILLARTLGLAVYGVYGIILSELMWIEQTSAFGIPGAITKLTAEADDEAPHGIIESTGQTLLLILYLTLFGVCWVGAPWIARLFQIPDATSLLRVAILDIPVSGL